MKKKVFSILFVILLGGSLNVYFNKTSTLDIATARNVTALTAGTGSTADNTGPPNTVRCASTDSSSEYTITYCMCENSSECKEENNCPQE